MKKILSILLIAAILISNIFADINMTGNIDITGNVRIMASLNILEIPDCELWLDGDDTDTITLNGSDVSQWDDKSGNNYDVMQSTAVKQPTYILDGMNNRNILRFNGSSEYLKRIYTAGLNPSSITVFVVCSATGGAGTWRSPLTSRDTNQGYMLYVFSI